MNDVEVVELRSVGAMDSPTERDDGGASSDEHLAENLRVELPRSSRS